MYLGDAHGRSGNDLVAVGAVRSKRPLRILISYHYYKNADVGKLLDECFDDRPIDVFCDSGAYSALTQGEAIDPQTYIDWVNRWPGRFSAIAGPDVIGDPVASATATELMLKQVDHAPVLPTFHVGEDWKWLDRCLAMSKYIAFGGMVPYTRRRNLLGSWITKAFRVVPDETRVHGFGLTTWPLLTRFPWYSVDSSSWTSGFRYAQLMLFDERWARFREVKTNDREDLLRHCKLLQRYGLRPKQALASDYDRDLLVGVSVESWQRAEDWLNKRVYLVSGGATEGSNNSAQTIARGAKLYLSCAACDLRATVPR